MSLVERDAHIRFVPFCETRYALVDQYSFPEKDTTERICHNGVSNAIYACDGTISRTLPLHMYPLEGTIHPQILRSSHPHFQSRDPLMMALIQRTQLDRAQGRLEGFYTE
jgi:hypothetical protein